MVSRVSRLSMLIPGSLVGQFKEVAGICGAIMFGWRCPAAVALKSWEQPASDLQRQPFLEVVRRLNISPLAVVSMPLCAPLVS